MFLPNNETKEGVRDREGVEIETFFWAMVESGDAFAVSGKPLIKPISQNSAKEMVTTERGDCLQVIRNQPSIDAREYKRRLNCIRCSSRSCF
ncbi:MAG: hypothetical protein ACRCT1_02230 [Microcoleaceae cyanobacterium]